MERNQNRHDFTQTHTSMPLAVSQRVTKQLVLPLRFKPLAEVIDGAKHFF